MSKAFPELRKLVRRFVGRDDTVLSTEESKTAKEMYPEDYAEYIRQRKDFNAAWKQVAHAFCSQGMVKYQDLLKTLAAKGFPNVLSSGFTGLIGPDCKLYTLKKDRIEGAPSTSFYPSVKMNPSYGKGENNNWVFRGIKTDGTAGAYFYTEEFKKAAQVSKHEGVHQLDLLAIRKKWVPKVKSFNPADVRCVAATVLETLWQFTARVGTMGNATFGICTLQARHAKITPQGIVLRYLGKDSVATTHKLMNSIPEHKPLIKNITYLLQDKQPKEQIFTIELGDKRARLYPTVVNKYWHSLGVPAELGVHKIRTWMGTKIFAEAITKLLQTKRPKTLAEAKAGYKKAAEEVGKSLNHVRRGATGDVVTGVTALNSYVSPESQILYWKELGYPLPAKLVKYDKEV